jgi:hypothetical protein
MKTIYSYIGLFVILLLALTVAYVHAQPVNVAKVIKDKYTTTDADGVPYVRVVYESSNTTLLQGELIVSQFNTPDLMFNSDLWSAMDLLKNQYGFKVQHVMNTGLGTVGSHTNVYILMTK